METERKPFANQPVPRYSFFGTGRKSSKLKIKEYQCCLGAVILALLALALVVFLPLYLRSVDIIKRDRNNSLPVDDLKFKLPLQDENYIEQPLTNLTTQEEGLIAGINSLRKREALENILPSLPVDSPTFRHQLTTYTSKEAQEMSKLGYVLNFGTKKIDSCMTNSTSWRKKLNKPQKWCFYNSSKWFPEELRRKSASLKCSSSLYRTPNGVCNNLEKNTVWGSALRPFRRILLPEYEDGVSEPRGGFDGQILPTSREVSLAIHRPLYRNNMNFTVMLAVWGQFIDHDITATALSKGKNGAAISCCNVKHKHPECFPIPIKKSDPLYTNFNMTCMNFVRSAPAPVEAFGPREQFNQVTSFLDGSVMYGSDLSTMNQLRTFENGELKMLRTSSGDILPISNDSNDGCNRREESERGRYCFLSGDPRSNENLLLTSMHLLFARQHNIIARELARINMKWTDEKIFQESRKILGSQIQHITYNEFLPSIFPRELMTYLNMTIQDSGYSAHYNSSVDSTIANSFASAAFRFGHTLLPGLMQFLRNNASQEEYFELHKMLFNPFVLFEAEFLENVIKSVSRTYMQQADVYFNEDLTQKLFQKEKNEPCGLDLVALNIQRGRDHGLPSYPDWVDVCGFQRPTSFDNLKGIIDNNTVEELKKLYKSVDDIDLYTGGLAEAPITGGLLGPTITCILADQFFRMKIGDRFWYETEEEPQKFTLDQINELRKTTLAKIICKTSMVNKSQPYVMKGVGDGNQLKPCDEFEYPNLEPWKEEF